MTLLEGGGGSRELEAMRWLFAFPFRFPLSYLRVQMNESRCDISDDDLRLIYREVKKKSKKEGN